MDPQRELDEKIMLYYCTFRTAVTEALKQSPLKDDYRGIVWSLSTEESHPGHEVHTIAAHIHISGHKPLGCSLVVDLDALQRIEREDLIVRMATGAGQCTVRMLLQKQQQNSN